MTSSRRPRLEKKLPTDKETADSVDARLRERLVGLFGKADLPPGWAASWRAVHTRLVAEDHQARDLVSRMGKAGWAKAVRDAYEFVEQKALSAGPHAPATSALLVHFRLYGGPEKIIEANQRALLAAGGASPAPEALPCLRVGTPGVLPPKRKRVPPRGPALDQGPVVATRLAPGARGEPSRLAFAISMFEAATPLLPDGSQNRVTVAYLLPADLVTLLCVLWPEVYRDALVKNVASGMTLSAALALQEKDMEQSVALHGELFAGQDSLPDGHPQKRSPERLQELLSEVREHRAKGGLVAVPLASAAPSPEEVVLYEALVAPLLRPVGPPHGPQPPSSTRMKP